MQGLENDSTSLPLGTAWHSRSAALNRSIIFLSETKVYGIIYLDG